MAPKRKPAATPVPAPPKAAASKSAVATRSSSRPATRSSVAASSVKLVALTDAPAKKRAKTGKKEKSTETKEAEASSAGASSGGGSQSSKTIVVEHCLQCKSFKVRATSVKDGLEKAIPGIKVILNPEQPRRGCFEVREEGGEPYISLLDLKRPFKKMKELNMDEVIADIAKQINV